MNHKVTLFKWVGTLTLGLTLTVLSGCGFEVKDRKAAVGFDTAKLVSSRSTHQGVINSLRTEFKLAEIDLNSQSPEIEVRLTRTAYDVAKLASSGVGSVSIEQLKLTQPFEVVDTASGKQLMFGEQVSTRDRRVDRNRLTVGQSELYTLQRAMRVELGKKIFKSIQRKLSRGSQNQGSE